MSDLKVLAKRLIEKFHPKIVLDAGCGKGELVSHFRNFNVEAYGIDVNYWVLARQSDEETKSYLCQADVGKMPFKDKIFDLIVCHHVIEHLSSHDSFINEVKRVLKNGGIIYVETPLSPFEAKRLWATIRIRKPVEHINLHTRRFWIKTFQIHGFRFIGDFREVLGYDAPKSCLGGYCGDLIH